MESTLSDEEFERLQNQLLELKTNNYSLEEQKRRNQSEIQTLRQRSEELEKQLSRAQTVNKINPLSLARNLANKVSDNKIRDKEYDHLVAENENLIRKIESQEQEFRVTNDTLRSEIRTLIAANEELELQLKNRSAPECDLGTNSTLIGDQIDDNSNSGSHSMPTNTGAISADHQNRLSYVILAEKEKLELKVFDLQELAENRRKENELIATQVEELQQKCMETDRLTQELTDAQSMVERQNSLIEEMRAYKQEIEQKFRLDCDKLKTEYQQRVEAQESRLAAKNQKISALETRVKELTEQLSQLDVVNKENEKLVNELDSYKEELSFCRTQAEETADRLHKESDRRCDELATKHAQEVALIQEESDDYMIQMSSLESDIKRLNQQILDDIEERKIHEKKGFLMVKELKRQLHSERKRADKLQERLQDLLNESTASISSDIRKQSLSCNGNGNNGNDSSSVGSWSFMSAKDNNNCSHNRTSSMHSGAGSEGRESSISPQSPTRANDIAPSGSGAVEKTASLLETENNELVSRITSLQQEKWVLEERINQLELSNSAMSDDINRKTELIQYYSMEGRPDRHSWQQSALHNSDKLTVKRVVDFIKDKGDENMREINRKVQRMLEETLTKNMHLQQNLDSLSQEVVRLNHIIGNNINNSNLLSTLNPNNQ